VKNILVIAGEKSGENHFMSFYRDLIEMSDQPLHFFGIGGDEMEREGVELIYHYRNFSAMGFSEVIPRINFFLRALKKIENISIDKEIDTALLIDYQGFNLELAKRLNKKGIKVLYYVAPQVWAWKSWRVKKLRKYVTSLFCIIPFEKKWFQKRGVENTFSVKHPLYLEYRDMLSKRVLNLKKKTIQIVLLPGSRNAEVRSLLPIFVKTISLIKKNLSIRVTLVSVKNVKSEYYSLYQNEVDEIVSSDKLAETLNQSDFAFCASGTVTLACALFNVPAIVTYKTSLLNEFVFRNFVSYKGYFSLANIIHNKKIYPELIQGEVDEKTLFKYFEWVLQHYEELFKELEKTKRMIAGENESDILKEMLRVIYA